MNCSRYPELKLTLLVCCVFAFQEARKLENIDQLEEFMLKHGENIVDLMGGEIDRIEMKLRVRRCSI